jgi:metal-responsive CopG/Arc/MetJ family transcriptional regulator
MYCHVILSNMSARTRNSRVFTISFPEPLAKKVEQVAREESRNISELFRETFRAYQADKLEKQLEVIRHTLPSTNYTPDDVERLVHEVRSQMRGKRKAKN